MGVALASPLPPLDEARCEVEDDGWNLRAVAKVRADDPHLRGHFPAATIFPGVFTVEILRRALAETRVIATTVLSRVRSARFLAPIGAGDVVTMAARLRRQGRGDEVAIDARFARADGVVAARVKATCGAVRPVAADELPITEEASPANELVAADVAALLPHRFPMVLVDRAVPLGPAGPIIGLKAVTASELCYRHCQHDSPELARRFPVTLQMESFGQTAALLWLQLEPLSPDHVIMLGAVRDFEAHGHAYPGEVMRHRAHISKLTDDCVIVEGTTSVGRRMIASTGSMIAVRRPWPQPQTRLRQDGAHA